MTNTKYKHYHKLFSKSWTKQKSEMLANNAFNKQVEMKCVVYIYTQNWTRIS